MGLLAKLTLWRRIESQDAPYIRRGHAISSKEHWHVVMEVQLCKLQDAKAH
jgi:hypothetical protein